MGYFLLMPRHGNGLGLLLVCSHPLKILKRQGLEDNTRDGSLNFVIDEELLILLR